MVRGKEFDEHIGFIGLLLVHDGWKISVEKLIDQHCFMEKGITQISISHICFHRQWVNSRANVFDHGNTMEAAALIAEKAAMVVTASSKPFFPLKIVCGVEELFARLSLQRLSKGCC